MGLSPVDVDQMSYWQLFATAEGWAEAHKTDGMTERDADDIWDWMATMPPVPVSHKRKDAINGGA